MDPIDICEASALQPFVSCLDRRGIDSSRHLERQGIPPDLVASGSGKILKRKAWAFFADVSRRENIKTLGFLDGDPFSCADLGSLGEAVHRGVTLQDSIDTFRRLVPSFAQGNTVWLERGPQLSWLCCHTARLDPVAHIPNDFTLLLLTALVRTAGGPDWRPLAVRCQTKATRTGRDISHFADIETTFLGNSSAIALPSNLLDQEPVTRSQKSATRHAVPAPAPSITDSLQQVLESLLDYRRLPTCNEAAEMLGVHRRTLLRALQKEGLTYLHLVERVRFAAARRLLIQEDLRIGEIADRLGYSSSNNFGRAFRRFGGLTPSQFRRDHD